MLAELPQSPGQHEDERKQRQHRDDPDPAAGAWSGGVEQDAIGRHRLIATRRSNQPPPVAPASARARYRAPDARKQATASA